MGQDLLEGLGRPAEGMSDLVPFINECEQLVLEFLKAGEIRRHEPFALQDGEPLLDLVHPGTMDGREVHAKPWMLLEPRADLLALMHSKVVADEVDECYRAGESAEKR